MSDARLLSWLATCSDYSSYGVTPGDTFHQGLKLYDSAFPCPNGLGVINTLPRDCPAWNRRVAKARKDAEEHAIHIDWIDSMARAHSEWASDDVARLKALSEGLYE